MFLKRKKKYRAFLFSVIVDQEERNKAQTNYLTFKIYFAGADEWELNADEMNTNIKHH